MQLIEMKKLLNPTLERYPKGIELTEQGNQVKKLYNDFEGLMVEVKDLGKGHIVQVSNNLLGTVELENGEWETIRLHHGDIIVVDDLFNQL